MRTEFLLTALLFAIEVQAQTQKGNGILSGGVTLNHVNIPSDLSKSTDSQPSVNVTYGSFIKDGWLLGAELLFSGQYTKSNKVIGLPGVTHVVKSYPSLRPFFRKYESLGPVQVFAGAGVQFSAENFQVRSQTGSSATRDPRSNTYAITPNVEVGATYFLSNRLALEGKVSAAGLPVPVSNIGLGLVYWTGPNGTGTLNPDSPLTTTKLGNWIIEGNLSFNKIERSGQLPDQLEAENTRSFSLGSSIGYFIDNNLLIGIGLTYGSWQTLRPASVNTYQSYSVAPFIQKYITNRRLTPYLRASILYSSNRTRNSDQRIDSWRATGGLGLAYRLTNRFIIETSLANAFYENTRFLTSGRIQTFNFSAQLGSNFSLRYVIAGKN